MGGKRKNKDNDDDDDDDVVMKDQDQKEQSDSETQSEESEQLQEVDDPADEDHEENEDEDDEEEEEEAPPTKRRGRSSSTSKGSTNTSTGSSRKRNTSKKNYADVEDSATDEATSESDESNGDESESDMESVKPTRRNSRSRRHSREEEDSEEEGEDEESSSSSSSSNAGKRRSGRSTKFTGKMKDPSNSLKGLFQQADEENERFAAELKQKQKQQQKTKVTASRSKSKSPKASTSISRLKSKASKPKKKPVTKKKRRASPTKSRRHSTNRRSNRRSVLESDEEEESEEEDESDAYMEVEEDSDEMDYDEDEEEEEEPDETLKVQRILAVRTETRNEWKQICANMQSSEVTDGSRWYQEDDDEDEQEEEQQSDDNENDDAASKSSTSSSQSKNNNQKKEKKDKGTTIEERYLVKWNLLSYLHVSWETQHDLIEQCDNAKQYISTFFKKQQQGCLYTADERKDGDYFDPGLCQIDRVVEIVPPNGMSANKKTMPLSWDGELLIQQTLIEDHGIVLDNKTDPQAFEAGAGRQFCIKWSSLNYNEMSYEFERDLMLCGRSSSSAGSTSKSGHSGGSTDHDTATTNESTMFHSMLHDQLKEKLQEYYTRTRKPTRKQLQKQKKAAENAKRGSYVLFGDKSRQGSTTQEKNVKLYQEQLANHIYQNGGCLRDYQAEGVTWFLANYINQRSCIMADEMGLGKTLQTAAFIHLLIEKMHIPGPFLICVPLSTLAHWQREFIGWTGLNTIVYHGSAEDRQKIREHEFAFPKDRPQNPGNGVNSLYLKKCEAAKKGALGITTQWMATVVITTPEMLVADDWTELSFVKWSVLVVDEAHRLKNHNSKLALNMRKEQFKFQHKLLLTGTPIQNDVKEFWTLLNFIDPTNYDDVEAFVEEYGDMKSKDKIDELHETIRPYILRRLKEDVEKSVPPKEETLIEVELTLSQKQYYRALYEKNVGFLHKNKKKAMDGPSLNNLAMQLRKCCNHLFLLKGIEPEMRAKEKQPIDEGDFVTGGSGKLVLLDKLLPRLKTDGHRILIFSQFKIMLDILEDYLMCRTYKFERIDGSITGNKRQSAIDRFQDPNSQDPPFVMLLSTRAGGVGINLTAADTCVIFDSDWNPQNDIQAMARCHRIGQTKNVKVYRLLTRKTYEMQMFHMSSLKMGLDQAVLTGFESSSSGEGAMTKEEVEKLLRHGAYDIFNEDKAGTAEAESNDFQEQTIDSILSRRSRNIVHENTGSGSAAAGGTFSKASFVNKTTPSKKEGDDDGTGGGGQATEDIDINDPDFWTKMVGEAKPEEESILKPRSRSQVNYTEKNWDKNLQKALNFDEDEEAVIESDPSDDEEDSDESADDPNLEERYRWGGKLADHWEKEQVESVVKKIERKGYNMISWEQFAKELPSGCDRLSQAEVKRMSWSLVLLAICEVSSSQGSGEAKRSKSKAERDKKRKSDEAAGGGDSLAEQSNEVKVSEVVSPKSDREFKDKAFKRLWAEHCNWAIPALTDATTYAQHNTPRKSESTYDHLGMIRSIFKEQLWPSLLTRGWKVEDEGDEEEKFISKNKQIFTSASAVLNDVIRIHPELQNMILPLLEKIQQSQQLADQKLQQDKMKDLAITDGNVDLQSLQKLLQRYSPKQLLHDRHKKVNRISLRLKLLFACLYAKNAIELVGTAESRAAASSSPAAAAAAASSDTNATKSTKHSDSDKLVDMLGVDGRSGLPHPLWNRKHDAILIRSVAKHGWLDLDSNLKRIVNDKDIKWGFPFEPSDDAPIVEVSEQEQANLRQTAERAAAILNDAPTVIETLTGFNKTLVIDSYGLTPDVDEDKMDDGNKKWKVDESLLIQDTKNNESAHEGVDLPAKKDFVKRAKLVISRTMLKLRSGITNNEVISSTKTTDDDTKSSAESNGYILIDQGNRCNILLAELCRGVIIGSTKNAVQLRQMWLMSLAEATSLKSMLTPQNDKKKEIEELSRILKQITLAKQTAKRATSQAKNVLRVMLGEKPVAPRNSKPGGEITNIFPSEKKLAAAVATTAAGSTGSSSSTKAKAAPKKKVKKNEPPLGEKAIVKAMKKAQDHNSGKEFGFVKDKDDLGLQLTHIEVYILTAFCSEGMPLLSISSYNSSNTPNTAIVTKTWKDVADAIEVIARHQLQVSKEKVIHCKQALTKGSNQKLDDEKVKLLASNLSKAESDNVNSEEAARLAADFTSVPDERLSKKGIMLMEKVRSYGSSSARPNGKNSTSHKYDHFLGAKVSNWYKKELARIAAQYDILDDENKPQAWTTADICKSIENNPEYNKMVVSALVDKPSARQVTCQIALLSRLRSILLKHTEKDFRVKLQRAMKNSKRADDEWDKKPEWWDDSTDEHAFLLLKKLNEYGFSKFMTSEKARDGFGKPKVDYDDMADDLKLTKPAIQTKANQLIRELDIIENHEDVTQMLERRRSSNSQKRDSLASCSKNDESSSSPSSSSGAKKSTVQTGIGAFFGKKKTPSPKNRTSTGSNDSSSKKNGIGNGDNPSPASGSKRKESPSPLGNAQVIDAIVGKSSSSSNGTTTSSPPAEKKIKTTTPEQPQKEENPQENQPMEVANETPTKIEGKKSADAIVID